MSKYIHLIILSLLLISIGYVSGRLSSALEQKSNTEFSITPIPDINQPQPVITLLSLTDNKLMGKVNIPTTRIVIDDDIAFVEEDNTFQIDTKPILNLKFIEVPEGVEYVANENGSKVYPVQSGGASRINPEKRIYFKSLEEAMAAGFRE